MESVPMRCPRDQFTDTVDELRSIGILSLYPVHAKFESQSVGIRDRFSRRQPRAKDGVTIERFAETSVLRSANRDVESNAVSGYNVESIGFSYVFAVLAD